jgi:hypothetical protein
LVEKRGGGGTRVHTVQVLEREDNRRCEELARVVREAAGTAQVREQLPTAHKLHVHIQVQIILARPVQRDDHRVVDRRQDRFLRHDVVHLLQADDLGLHPNAAPPAQLASPRSVRLSSAQLLRPCRKPTPRAANHTAHSACHAPSSESSTPCTCRSPCAGQCARG